MTPQQALQNLAALVVGWEGQPGMAPTYDIHTTLRQSIKVLEGVVAQTQVAKAKEVERIENEANGNTETSDATD